MSVGQVEYHVLTRALGIQPLSVELQIDRVRNKRAGPLITLVNVTVQTPVQTTIVKGPGIPSALPTYWLAGTLSIDSY